MFLSMTSNRQQRLQVAVAVVLSSCFLCPTGAIRALSYNERIAGISRLLPHNQPRNSHDREVIADFKRFLETLSQSLVQDALLESVRILSGSEYSHVKFGIGEALQVNETDGCVNHTAAVIIGVIEKEGWALQMLDALGKPSPGIMVGNLNWPGAYDQCLDVRANISIFSGQYFSGQYFSASILLEGNQEAGGFFPLPAVTFGVCVPDSCSPGAVQLLLTNVLHRLNVSYSVIVVAHPKDRPLDTKAIIGIIICSIIASLMVLGTLLDLIHLQIPKWRAQEASFAFTNGEMDDHSPLLVGNRALHKVPEVGLCTQLLTSFSVYTNGAKLLSTRQPPGSLSCVHGIRFLSMTWVVLGHSIGLGVPETAYTMPYFQKAVKRWSFQVVLSGVVSVDTFFLLSGLLVTYMSLREMKKRNGKLNWFIFFFHRFWRLTPALMLIIMVYVCLSPYWGHGPLWMEQQPDRDNCEINWWTNLLYVNNLVRSKTMCLGQSWYLANDMQFYILSPLIFVPFYFSPWFGAISSGVFLLVSALTPGLLAMRDNFPPSILAPVEGRDSITSIEEYMTLFYIKPYNRMGPYIVGMLGGYFLFRTNCNLRLRRVTNLCMWAVAIAAALAVVYGLYDSYNGHPVSVPVSAFYNAVSRHVWAACVCWVIIACVTGNGGFVNTILSWSPLIPLSRLTYCIYLLHILVIEVYTMNTGTMFYAGDINYVMTFLSVLMISYMAAFVASLAFESPMLQIERVLLRQKRKEEKMLDASDVKNLSDG